MKNDIVFKATGYSKKQKRKKLWIRIVAFLSAIVVFCTTYALILPGITRERTAYCGFEEHTHGEGCYEIVSHKTVNCTASVHQHIEGVCYDTEGNIFCRTADYLIHTHNETCYDENEGLICLLPEIELHTHSTECYESAALDSDSEEDESSVTEFVLVCEKPELAPHAHEEACFDENGGYICGAIELVEHIHTAECISVTEETLLLCEKEEHLHTEECYINTEVDVETEADWLETLPSQLSGIWRSDLVLVAESQLGYTESSVNVEIDENGVKHAYTRYGEWYGDPYGDWSEMFAAFCLNYSGVDSSIFPYENNTEEWTALLKDKNYYRDTLTYTPQPGDILFVDTRAAIITELITDESNTLTALKVIEGDSENCVRYCEYAIPNDRIHGYADIGAAYNDYKANGEIKKEYKDDRITVTASYFPYAEIPDDAELSVTQIVDSEKYQMRYDEALAALDDVSGQVKETSILDFWLYDICFISDGEEIQPNDSVDIQMELNETASEDTADISVVHFAEQGTEIPELISEETTENINVAFSVEGFSHFAIVTSSEKTLEMLSMSKNTSTTLTSVTAFAVVSETNALLVDVDTDGLLTPMQSSVYTHDTDSNLTIDARAQQWYISANGSGYNVWTTHENVQVYLMIDAGELLLTDSLDSAALFTRTWDAGELTLSSGGYYLDPGSQTLLNTASTTLSLYSPPSSGTIKVIFDAAIGYPAYMDGSKTAYGQKYKYEGAEYKELDVTAGSTIVLPHNDPTSTDTANYISISGGDTNTLNDWYELNGWYDAINKIFYDRSMLGKEIKVTTSTIFYPEYIAKDYNAGFDNGHVIPDQPDTRDFINTYMFDYNEIFNVDKAYITDFVTDSNGRYVTKWTVDTTDESAMVFFDYITVWNSNVGNLGYMNGRSDADANGITLNEEKTAGTRGSDTTFPGTITSNILGPLGTSNVDNPRLDALFTKETIPGRVYLGEGDWFYDYDENIGFYYYNSAANAAAYNQEEQRFYIYDYPVRIDNNNSQHDFTPYTYRDTSVGDIADDGSPSLREKDNEVNYWVGMQSEIEFYLPEDSGSANNISSYGDDLQFRFSGDDDVWIFVDGQLVVDLGGVHDVVYGEINFATGLVTTAHSPSSSEIADNVASNVTEMPGVSETNRNGVTVTDLPHLEGGQYHTVTVYYLERGSALSNCAIYFNISPFYELEILKRDSTTGEGLEGAEFTVYSDPECTQVAQLYTRNENGDLVECSAVFVTDADGIARCEGLYSGATYYIKETKPPDGYPDMSMYIIVANLAQPGESVTIAVDSNGNEWVFADEYVYSDEDNHRIELNVYNSKYIGGEKELYVKKEWAEGSEPVPITLRLYANGAPTDRTIILNEDCNWEAFFYYLPETDDDGNEIIYTVKEENGPANYGISYAETTGQKETIEIIPGYWQSASTLTAGNTYRFVYNGMALSCNSDGSVTPSSANEMDHSTHWIAETSGNKFLLRNEYYETRYLYIANGSVSTTTTTSTNNQLTWSSGRLSVTYRSGWRNYTYYLVAGNSSYSTTTSSNSGTTFSLYEWVPPQEVLSTTDVPGWRVTNTPWEEYTSVPIVKTWDATVGTVPTEQKFSLYLVTEGQENNPVWVSDITLDGNNSWMGSFENLAYPEDGSYYCIVEVTDDYQPSYNNETVSIYVNEKFKEAAKVEFDQNGIAKTVEVNNSKLLLLPETGGLGTIWYTIGGMLLVVSAVLLLLYKIRKRRSEDYFSP